MLTLDTDHYYASAVIDCAFADLYVSLSLFLDLPVFHPVTADGCSPMSLVNSMSYRYHCYQTMQNVEQLCWWWTHFGFFKSPVRAFWDSLTFIYLSVHNPRLRMSLSALTLIIFECYLSLSVLQSDNMKIPLFCSNDGLLLVILVLKVSETIRKKRRLFFQELFEYFSRPNGCVYASILSPYFKNGFLLFDACG